MSTRESLKEDAMRERAADRAERRVYLQSAARRHLPIEKCDAEEPTLPDRWDEPASENWNEP